MMSNFYNGDTKHPEDEGLEVVISSSKGQVSISTSQKNKFLEVSKHFFEVTGWHKIETRFTLDGERLQDDLTLDENGIKNGTVIDAFKEMVGGKGPDDDAKKILQMLEECDSDAGETSENEEVRNPLISNILITNCMRN